MNERSWVYEGRLFRIEIERFENGLYRVFMSYRANGMLNELDDSSLFDSFEEAYDWAFGSINEMEADLLLIKRNAGEAV